MTATIGFQSQTGLNSELQGWDNVESLRERTIRRRLHIQLWGIEAKLRPNKQD